MPAFRARTRDGSADKGGNQLRLRRLRSESSAHFPRVLWGWGKWGGSRPRWFGHQ